MRILLTVHQFFPRYGSGTEVLTLTVARELTRRGHEVLILAAEPTGPGVADDRRLIEDVFDGIRILRFLHFPEPMGRQRSATELEFRNDLVAEGLATILKTWRPDLVHVFHFARLGVRIVDAAVQENIPVFYTATDFWAVCATSQLMLPTGASCSGPTRHAGNCVKHMVELGFGARWRPLLRVVPDGVADLAVSAATLVAPDLLPMGTEVAAIEARSSFILFRLRSVAAIFVPTAIMEDVLTKNGVPPALQRRVPYGIDLSHAPVDASLPSASDGKLRVGFVGTLSPHKGCHVLIDAIRGIDATEVELEIYGDPMAFPDYVARLRERASGASNIEFRGTFDIARIFDVFSELDVLVVPSIWFENAPLVLHAAMAARRPAIASRFPGMSEVVRDGENGLLFTPGDASDLRRCLIRVLSDRGYLRELAARCTRPRSTEDYVDDLLDVYVECLQRQSSPRDRIPLPGADAPRDAEKVCVLVGWAVVRFDEPRSVILRHAGREVARARDFVARQDVRTSLSERGNAVRGVAYGFRIEIPDSLKGEILQAQVTSAWGRSFRAEVSEASRGCLREVGPGDWLAIDAWTDRG